MRLASRLRTPASGPSHGLVARVTNLTAAVVPQRELRMAAKPLLFILMILAFASCGASLGAGAYSESEPEVPEPSARLAQIVVRPDRIEVPFVFATVEERDVARATGLVRQAHDDLMKRIGTVAGAQVQMRGFRADDESVRAFGSVVIAVTGAQDYWARVGLATAVEKALNEMEVGALKTKLRVNHEAARASLVEPEARRAELVEIAARRLSEVVGTASTKGTPLRVTDCAMPGAVIVEPISFEEIGLALEVGCSLRTRE